MERFLKTEKKSLANNVFYARYPILRGNGRDLVVYFSVLSRKFQVDLLKVTYLEQEWDCSLNIKF